MIREMKMDIMKNVPAGIMKEYVKTAISLGQRCMSICNIYNHMEEMDLDADPESITVAILEHEEDFEPINFMPVILQDTTKLYHSFFSKAINYFNYAVNIDLKTYLFTVKDIRLSYRYLKLAAANITEVLFDLFQDGISYLLSRKEIAMNGVSETYPEYNGVEMTYSKLQDELLAELKSAELAENFDEVFKLVICMRELFSINDISLYPDKIDEVKNHGLLNATVFSDYANYIMPYDLDMVLNGKITEDAFMATVRAREVDEDLGETDLQILINVYDSIPSEYEYLFRNEQYLLLPEISDLLLEIDERLGKIPDTLKLKIEDIKNRLVKGE